MITSNGVWYYGKFALFYAQKHEGWSFLLKASATDFFGYIPSGISLHQDENQKPKDSDPNYPSPTMPVIKFQVSYFAVIPPSSSEAPDAVTTVCSDVRTYLSTNYKDCW